MDKLAGLIEERLEQLANSTRVDGEIWRAVYTKEDVIAKRLIKNWMENAGLAVYEDSIGNVFGKTGGDGKSVVLVGSHIDTVRNGGKYDGATGIVTAIYAVQQLIEEYGSPDLTIEVVALAEEEGSRYEFSYIGSKAITRKLIKKHLYEKDRNGITLYQAMRNAGYNPDKFQEAIRNDLNCFIELHIEQGPILEQMSAQVGIVENIVGIVSYNISIKGVQNHAGTTPIEMRKDPVYIAANFIGEATKKVRSISDTATITFSKLQSIPDMSNVISREVRFSIDIRDGASKELSEADNCVLQYLAHIEEQGYQVCIKRQCNEMPISLDPKIIAVIEDAAKEENMEAIRLNSGAGHDAQIFADVIPTGMIFIPSINGISHSPEEYTTLKGLESGLLVLKRTIKKLAWG
jgi:allantoate deiminase